MSQQNKPLEGTSALVTGAASGIGAATAVRLAALGARVVVADLQETAGRQIAADIGGIFARVDITNTRDVLNAVALAADEGPLRTVVNSAGVAPAGRTIGRDGSIESAFPLDKFVDTLRINLVGTFDVIRVSATQMSSNPMDDDGCRGAIVNLASVAAFEGQVGQAAYAASKGGIVGLTLPVARDLSVVGIRVNTVAPGLVDTPIYGEGASAEVLKAKLSESVLFPQRLARPDDVARAIVECALNPYINGTVVRVDGGIRMPAR